jgi:hypothetical protein
MTIGLKTNLFSFKRQLLFKSLYFNNLVMILKYNYPNHHNIINNIIQKKVELITVIVIFQWLTP